MGPMNFSGGPPALVLRYQTDLKIANTEALRREVDEVWTVFQHDVEKGNFPGGIITASEVPTGRLITHGNSFNFVYNKDAGGIWRCLCDSVPGQK